MNKVNAAAFLTTTVLSVATVGSVVGCVSVTSKVPMVAFGVLRLTFSAVSFAAITAWIALEEGKDVESYFKKLGSHSAIAIAATYQFVSQTLIHAAVRGVSEAFSIIVRDKLLGGKRSSNA